MIIICTYMSVLSSRSTMQNSSHRFLYPAAKLSRHRIISWLLALMCVQIVNIAVTTTYLPSLLVGALRPGEVISCSETHCSETTMSQVNNRERTKQFFRTRPPPSADCLVVFHPPKSGGVSLGEMLESRVANELNWTLKQWYTFASHYRSGTPPTDANLTSFNSSIYHLGHITPRFLDETGTQNCWQMTLLREPVDRVVSAFYYHKHTTSEWDACLFGEKRSACRYQGHQYKNDVVRMFTSEHTWNSYFQEYYDFYEDLDTDVDRTSLHHAQQFLKDLDLVCFLDQFENCFRQLQDMLGVERTKQQQSSIQQNSSTATATTVPHANINPERPKRLPEYIYNKIRSQNQLDLELYAWAREQFAQ